MTHIYIDGSWSGKSKCGGWAVRVDSPGVRDHRGEIAPMYKIGHICGETSQYMEVFALKEALKILHAGQNVTLHTDSKYIEGMLTRGWAARAHPGLWSTIRQLLDRLSLSLTVIHHERNSTDEMEDIDNRANIGRKHQDLHKWFQENVKKGG